MVFANFGREIVFSADLRYIRVKKNLPLRGMGHAERDRRSPRGFRFVLTSLWRTLSHPTSSVAPSQREL